MSEVLVHRLSLLLLLVLVSAPGLATAGPKDPTPPPDFERRAMTGTTFLENLITDAIALEGMTAEELEALAAVALEEGQGKALSRYIAALIGRDQLPQALEYLQRRARADLSRETNLADVLDLAMGQLRWGACADIVRSRLERRMDRSLFLLRALCLRRSGDPEGAAENLRAADTLEPLGAETLALVAAQLEERASGHQLPPATDAVYGPIQAAFGNRGALSQLFVYHFVGRADPAWVWGNIGWGGFGASELRQVILSRSRSYRYCHEAAMRQGKRRKKGLSGEATVVWRIDALGRVGDVKIAEEDWGGHEQADWLNACLIDQIQRLRFPRTHYGLPMPARHRFSFDD